MDMQDKKWYVENINGDGSTARKYFDTYQEAKDHAEWTLGKIGYLHG